LTSSTSRPTPRRRRSALIALGWGLTLGVRSAGRRHPNQNPMTTILHSHQSSLPETEEHGPGHSWSIFYHDEPAFAESEDLDPVLKQEGGIYGGEINNAFLTPDIIEKIVELHQAKAFRHQHLDEPVVAPTNKPPHLQRLIKEKEELVERLEKLVIFINNPAIFSILSPSERQRLITQRKIMFDLSDILGECIAAFGRAS
jgi:hypothetical protein